MSEQVLTVRYLPLGPQKFHASFQIQVAHFEPDTVNLYGEGVFPRIFLNLPKVIDPEGRYERLVREARDNVIKESSKATERPTSGMSDIDEAAGCQFLQVFIASWGFSVFIFHH